MVDFILLLSIITGNIAAWHWGRLNERGRWLRAIHTEAKLMAQSYESVRERHEQGEWVTDEELEFLRGRREAAKAIWPGRPE